jgi:flagellar protein FliO/FliZ
MVFHKVILAALTTWSLEAWSVSILENVNTRFDEGNFVTELKFTKAPHAENILVEYIDQTVQVSIPNATVREGKFLKKVNKSDVKSVFSYQFDKNTLRTRIIYNKGVDTSKFEGLIKISKKEDVILVTILDPNQINTAKVEKPKDEDLEVVPPLDIEKAIFAINKKTTETDKPKEPSKNEAVNTLASEVKPTQVNLPAKATEAKIDAMEVKTDFKNNITEPAKESEIPVFKKQKELQKAESSATSRLIFSLIVISLFGGALFVFAKWWNKNHKLNDKHTKIQVLTQHHLGPRKSLAIIRVAGESILLGVTDQNISMIKTLSFIDDEVLENVPSNFQESFDFESSKAEDLIKEQKMTYDPGQDLVKDLRSQVANKLKNLKDI